MPSTTRARHPKKRRTSKNAIHASVARIRRRPEIPNDDLIRTLKAAEKDIKKGNLRSFSTVEEFLEYLNS